MRLRLAFWRSHPDDIKGLKDAQDRLVKSTAVADNLRREDRRNNFGRIFQEAFAPPPSHRHRKAHP